ncbi:MAG TPA: hypothetical protein VF532_07390 [Candidatus Angelobacter sp.]
MVRRLLWVALVATSSLTMVGQVQQTPVTAPGAPVTQVYQGPVYVPVNPPVVGGYYTGYTGGGYYGIATPTARFDSPQPTAGISLADRTGISISTPSVPFQSTLQPSTVVHTNVEPAVAPAAPEEIAAPAAAGPAISGPRLAYELGPTRFAGAAVVGAAAPPPAIAASLGEVAAQYKKPGLPSIRRYTNEDVERMNASMSLGGININARLGATPAVPPAQTAQAQPPANATGPSAAGAQPTTPQVAPPQPGEQAPIKQLPATSTLLPLIGILGLAGGGIGLLVRRYRTR